MEKSEDIAIEFDYCILRDNTPIDDCYATISLSENEIENIVAYLMEQNSEGELLDLPETIVAKIVDAALDDAVQIYPNFNSDDSKLSIALQRYMPDDLLDYLPDELIENFTPDMFEEVDGDYEE